MKNRGFTLLELLLVITLVMLVFGIIGFSFVNFLTGNANLSARINKTVNDLSVYNQISKQMFSVYTGRKINIKIDANRISIYTLYPVFYEGAVRAEYYIKEENKKKILIYEEYPYVDGRLGHPGLKKMVLGEFQSVSFEVLKDGRFTDRYTGQKIPPALRITTDGGEYIITGRK
ncbi:prepilin-type N-terminal cleavage/methylation domain-containing protein [Persephonella sp.]